MLDHYVAKPLHAVAANTVHPFFGCPEFMVLIFLLLSTVQGLRIGAESSSSETANGHDLRTFQNKKTKKERLRVAPPPRNYCKFG